MSAQDDRPDRPTPGYHGISGSDFDALAGGGGGARVINLLRETERSQRVLLLRSLIDQVEKSPQLAAPLPPPFAAWDLLARAENADPAAVNLVINHPHTGSWVRYSTRLLINRISGKWPFWVHFGYVYTLAAAAAIRARIRFAIHAPVWHRSVTLPTLGILRLPATESTEVVEITGGPEGIVIRTGTSRMSLPRDLSTDEHAWRGIRTLTSEANGRAITVRLDDVDPYRGAYEPLPPQRIAPSEAVEWQRLLSSAWTLLAHVTPEIADELCAGFESITPGPLSLFRPSSASSSDAFGSAVLDRPKNAANLAAMIVHEFQHSKLAGLSTITQLCENDPRERFYAPWRSDPRPVNGLLQGLYAFLGMTSFWREMSAREDRSATLEFAFHRAAAWRVAVALRRDTALTGTGSRFVSAITETLRPWLAEPVPPELATAADRILTDHYLGWRIRHLRPNSRLVREVARAWLEGQPPARPRHIPDASPTPVPDGTWTHARADLTRLAFRPATEPLRESWKTVPEVTRADFALVTGRFHDAIRDYRAIIAGDPDSPTALVGITLALAEVKTSAAVRTLRSRPELVRAVHREIRARADPAPDVEHLADWIGRNVL